MAKGLTVFSRHDSKAAGGLLYVLAEFDTEKDDEKELASSTDIAKLLRQVPQMEKEGGYDGGVTLDLTTPVE